MITGRRVDGLEHSSDLRGGAEMHALADLRAGTDQRVRVDHRAFVDVGSDIDEHGRHADDRRSNVGSRADRRASGNDADAIGDGKLAGRESVFVDEGEAGGHFRQNAQTEAEQNALLDPGVDGPAAVYLFRRREFCLG